MPKFEYVTPYHGVTKDGDVWGLEDGYMVLGGLTQYGINKIINGEEFAGYIWTRVEAPVLENI